MNAAAWHPQGHDDLKALAAATRVPIPDLLAMDRKNDPFFAGSPSQRDQAAWFAELWNRLDLQPGIHLRRIHYRLLSVDGLRRHDGRPYANSDACWDYLTEASKWARYLRLVRPDAFTDHRNPRPRRLSSIERADETPSVQGREVPAWNLPTIVTDLGDDLAFTLPRPKAAGYAYAESAQPYLLEVWVEKSTVDDVVLPVCEALGMSLVTSVGFQSITSVIALLRDRVAAAGKPARIFYISDFDPAGDRMPVQVARQVEYWLGEYAPEAEVKLLPLALTRAQVVAYRLPRIPIKDTDLRKAHFEERYGEGAVELDALEALYPGRLGEILREAATPYFDRTLRPRRRDARLRAQRILDRAWEEASAPYRDELGRIDADVRAVLDRYRNRLAELAAELDADLAPFRQRLEEVRQAIQDAADDVIVGLPDCPGPSVAVPDESSWLFDSTRDYLTQIAAYQAHRRGAATADCAPVAAGRPGATAGR